MRFYVMVVRRKMQGLSGVHKTLLKKAITNPGFLRSLRPYFIVYKTIVL